MVIWQWKKLLKLVETLVDLRLAATFSSITKCSFFGLISPDSVCTHSTWCEQFQCGACNILSQLTSYKITQKLVKISQSYSQIQTATLRFITQSVCTCIVMIYLCRDLELTFSARQLLLHLLQLQLFHLQRHLWRKQTIDVTSAFRLVRILWYEKHKVFIQYLWP